MFSAHFVQKSVIVTNHRNFRESQVFSKIEVFTKHFFGLKLKFCPKNFRKFPT